MAAHIFFSRRRTRTGRVHSCALMAKAKSSGGVPFRVVLGAGCRQGSTIGQPDASPGARGWMYTWICIGGQKGTAGEGPFGATPGGGAGKPGGVPAQKRR